MNERIRELAAEARLLAGWPVGEVEYQKFAELIIQDCVNICDAYGMPDGTSATAALLSAAIKRKFGIEDVNESLRRRSTYFGNNP